MGYNILENITYCKEFVDGVTSLILYSHVPPAIIALVAGFYVIVKDKKSILARLFFAITICLSLWSFLDLAIWFGYDKNSSLMYSWSIIELVSVLLFVLSFYFIYVFVSGKDIPIWLKLILTIILVPIIVTVPTSFNLLNYDIQECIATENNLFLTYNNYLKLTLSIPILLLPILFAILKKTRRSWPEILLVTIGLATFIFSFLGVGYIATHTQDFLIEMYGLFAIIVFIIALFYSIVKFKTFNIKIFVTQVLILSLIVLIASQLFYVQTQTNLVLTISTLLISIIFGLSLVKSVRKEIKQREEIENLVTDLKKANDRLKQLDKQKSEFVSLASHQLRGPLTAIKGYVSLVLEGDYGEISKDVKDALGKVSSATKDLAILVGDYLDVSRIELGRMKYNFSSFSLNDLVDEVINEMRPTIDKAGLELKIDIDKLHSNVNADRNKIKQVFLNLLDNSIKYTPEGYIKISLHRDETEAVFEISDSGVGIKKEVIPNLFAKFSRAPNANQTNVIGTGLGLYLVKNIIEEHSGDISVNSAGEGKGSTFTVKLKLV